MSKINANVGGKAQVHAFVSFGYSYENKSLQFIAGVLYASPLQNSF